MAHSVTLQPFGLRFACGADETVLDAALRNGVNLRYGCRDGGCGTCKTRVLSGEIEQEGASTFALMDFEREQGYALLCSAHPLTDVELDGSDYSEEELSSDMSVDGISEVIQVDQLTHDIRGLGLRLIAPERLSFTAGQYVEIQVPDTDEWRAYSMANPPCRSDGIELQVKLVPGGVFSECLRERLRPGDRLRWRGPFGAFRLREGGRPALLVAGGSGMAPMLSMLRDMADRWDARPATFFYGARSRRDLFLLDEIDRIGRVLPRFHFVPALSEPRSDEGWDGETGLVTDVLARQLPRSRDFEAYLCGPPPMVDAAHALLLRAGLSPDRIQFDRFVTKADTVQPQQIMAV